MYKYEQSYKSTSSWTKPLATSYWNGADGEDVIKSFVNNPDHNGNYPGLEEKQKRIIEALGRIADKLGVDLLDVFDTSELESHFRHNQEK
jgi:hypothetical protein